MWDNGKQVGDECASEDAAFYTAGGSANTALDPNPAQFVYMPQKEKPKSAKKPEIYMTRTQILRAEAQQKQQKKTTKKPMRF